ncbi:alpha/beta-hydrolase [Metschnikowia bicuspidata var. bicuspidata NRRL YB-4993]|uniref:Alpha/beta-hydrolase n=1 Tax=Metschnikowia bicuspidata var. bicuspidata NRRL YB-4993 TaxID=869754 RepID=A0A1A0H8B9_9ASCO|nr:alpha/beta-hydrolase [Metschnikowia bicuspidata var. bicuspidata NRRL YB-4993]OBA20138.1 alpha/beta-hydrolase [Metschnikowia bicuspidata var. bicuspidata NRRL YB-4993]
MPSSAPIPHDPIGTPITEKVKCNGLDFETVTWKVPPNVEYKGKIVYVHGFAEHCSIYTEFFDKLSQLGYEVLFFDQRGAGETSPGKQVGKTDEYHTFKDLDFMIKRALDAREDKTEKLFLGGHSMGGGIALNYGIMGKHRDDIRAIFVSGPLVTLHPKTQPNVIVRKLLPVINALLPTLKIDSKLNYDYITSHEGWKNYIKSTDGKLIGTVRQFNDMFVRGEKLLSKDHTSKYSPTIPLLLLHGTDDNINDIESSKKFIELLPADLKKEFVPVENGRHSLFIENENIFKDVFDKVVEFLGSH